MSVELKVPAGSESITEVYIGEWAISVGDYVETDAVLVELETDKASQPLLATASGVVTSLLKEPGDTAEPGEVIAVIDETASAPAGDSGTDSESASSNDQPASEDAESRIMPAAARLMEIHGISESQVTPTGPGGRILKEDVQKVVDSQAAAPQKTTPALAAPSAPKTQIVRHTETIAAGSNEETVRMSRIRQIIAKRLVDAQQTAALLTTFNEIDMTAVMALRKQYQDEFVKKNEIKLGFMSFFVKAVIDGLKLYPGLNSEIRDQNIVYKNYYHISIAVGSEKGLVVPVVRNADQLSFAETEQTIRDYAIRAQAGQLNPEELQGGTFTISNGGVYGSLLSTPIVNPPQSGVLGMHSIQQRAVVVDGQVVARPMMYIALTYDHRIVDGREAVSFLKHIKDVVEDPTRLLLEI